MKKASYLIMFLISLYTIGNIHASNLSLFGKVIYLDPGHGGNDPGAVYKDIYEADINLEICLKLKEQLEKQGAIVYMTRYGNYDLAVKNTNSIKRSDLYQRSQIINDSNADIYLSIHLNADTSTKYSGAQVFYSNHIPENELIAKSLQEHLQKTLNTTREASIITDTYLFKRIDIKGVLIEAGFISNQAERENLQTGKYQEKIATEITVFLTKYFS